MSHATWSSETSKKSYCEDAYCTGHVKKTATCCCGKIVYSAPSSLDFTKEASHAHIKHRLDELEKIVYANKGV